MKELGISSLEELDTFDGETDRFAETDDEKTTQETSNKEEQKSEEESSEENEEQTESEETVEKDSNSTTTSEYLVDNVEIGDYVNIGINYTNKQEFSSKYTSTLNALSGWRVIAKTGSGETGQVKLVSASCPITFRYETSKTSTEIISTLSKLNTTINIATNGTGFYANGFNSNELETVFGTNSSYIDTTKGVHTITADEILAIYKEITKTETNISKIENRVAFQTAIMERTAGDNWEEKYTDLLNIGENYWIGGAVNSETQELLYINNQGAPVYNNTNNTYGIRPVVTLQSGVKVSNAETANGNSSNLAYKITK